MLGAIAGDMIGAPHEGRSPGLTDFSLFTSRSVFTDDTVLTVAIADAILSGKSYSAALREWGLRYPNAGYGHQFYTWLHAPTDPGPYNSYGNGAAMRVSSIGWAYPDWQQVEIHSRRSAEVTHNHPEGLKGASIVAHAIGAARHGQTKDQIADWFIRIGGYDIDTWQRKLFHDGVIAASTCQETVPAAAIAFLESKDFEGAIRLAVSFGGDTDTTACIAGAIAEAFYGGVPQTIEDEVRSRLDKSMLQIVNEFTRRYCKGKPKLALVQK